MKVANSKIVRKMTKHGGQLVRYLSKNSPTILTGCAVAGAFTAVVLAVRATKPALEHIREEKEEHLDRLVVTNGDQGVTDEEREEMIDEVSLKPFEVVQATWRDYIPTGIALAGTTACIIGAHTVNAKRLAAMAALYQISETTLKDYKEEAGKLLGKKKAEELKDAVNGDALERAMIANDGMFIETGHGSTKFMDKFTGRLFKSDFQYIRKVVNDLNQSMIGGDWGVSLNEFYQDMGLDTVGGGEDVGWSVNSLIELETTAKLMSDGSAVTVIGFKYGPDMTYRDI